MQLFGDFAAKRVQVELQDTLDRCIATATYDGAPVEQPFELPTAGCAPGLYWKSVGRMGREWLIWWR